MSALQAGQPGREAQAPLSQSPLHQGFHLASVTLPQPSILSQQLEPLSGTPEI